MVAPHPDLSLLALRVYTTPGATSGADPELNRSAVPAGWTEREWHADSSFGFSYGVYTKGSDVVIAFAGTNQFVDWGANVANVLGLSSAQTTKAALAYFHTKAQYAGNITFTGHSLGGGLASTMAAWFDRPAVVFDQAPFESTARSPLAIAYTNAILRLAGYSDPAFQVINVLAEFPRREAAVVSYAVNGEMLARARKLLPYVSGSDQIVSFGTDRMQARGIDLHSP
ncbi:MAG: lipase family protein [Ramlibacter sp.]